MPTDQTQQRSRPEKYTAREPRDEAGRLAKQIGPADHLAAAGSRAQAEDESRPGAARSGRGVR